MRLHAIMMELKNIEQLLEKIVYRFKYFLVAPLANIKKSIIGAGTVVNTDIPNETVVYRKSELIKKNKKK